ncbi:hypothetical protein FOL47_001682, partial [Perkinsus chesapeaki]
YMVENLPPVVAKVCGLLNVKDSSLLSFLTDADIDKYCGTLIDKGSLERTVANHGMVPSSNRSVISFASGDDHTIDDIPVISRMLQDGRSVTWFISELSNEARIYQLDAKSCWMLLQGSCTASVRVGLLQYVEDKVGSAKWLSDYSAMSAVGVDYLRSTYSASDDPSTLEDKVASLKQQNNENVFEYLDRLNEAVAQSRLCGLTLSEAQITKYYRQGLKRNLLKTANYHFSNITNAAKLATEVDKFTKLNGGWFQKSADGKSNNNSINNNSNNGGGSADGSKSFFSEAESDYIRKNKICFGFCKNGVCTREGCSFKHLSLQQVRDGFAATNASSTSGTSGDGKTGISATSTDSTKTNSGNIKYCADDTRSNRTLRVPQLLPFSVEVDTGSSCSIITQDLEFLCTHNDLIKLGDLQLSKDALPPFDDQVVDEDVLAPVKDDDFCAMDDGSKKSSDEGDGSKDQVINIVRGTKKANSNIDFTSVPLPDFSCPTFAHCEDEIVKVLYQNGWYRITVHKSSSSSFYFAADISNEAALWMDKLVFEPVSRIHWRWAKASPEARIECTHQIESFIANDKLCRTTDDRNLFCSNFYPVKGRKRHRIVLPLLRLNAALKYLMKFDPIINPQHRMSVAINRMRLSPSLCLLDIVDAYMNIRVLSNLSSKLQILFKGFLYKFQYLIYGQSCAPPTLEYAVQYLEGLCPSPSCGLPPACSFMDDLVKPSHVGSQQANCSTKVGSVSGDNKVDAADDICDSTIKLYAQYNFPLKMEILSDDGMPLTSLGLQLTQSLIVYRRDRFEALQNAKFEVYNTYRKALKLLGALTNDSDYLPLNLLPIKHCLIGLISAWLAHVSGSWDDPLPTPILECLADWWKLVCGSTLPSVRRYVDPGSDFVVYTDASMYMQCYRIYVDGDDPNTVAPLFQEQFVLSTGERSFHINTLELACVWRALSRFQLLRCDTGLEFTGTIT